MVKKKSKGDGELTPLFVLGFPYLLTWRQRQAIVRQLDAWDRQNLKAMYGDSLAESDYLVVKVGQAPAILEK